jgi:hypothetical protein
VEFCWHVVLISTETRYLNCIFEYFHWKGNLYLTLSYRIRTDSN